MVTRSLKKPRKTCNDRDCPFHGYLSVRGRAIEGIVVSVKMDKTIVVRRDYLNYVTKLRRYERRHSHIFAHHPSCIDVKEDDRVKVAECRPISKNVSFVVVEKLGEGRGGSKS